jgi:hypothetical protein
VFTDTLPSNEKGIHFIEPLPSNDRMDTNTDTRTDGRGFTKYAVEMGSGSMIYSYIPSFIKIGSDIQKLIRGIHRHTDSTKIA